VTTGPPGGPAHRLVAASAEEMAALGAALARAVGPGAVLALHGDLGAGKTCLVQGLAHGLGVAAPVTSPTFVLAAEHPGRLRLYHVDLYRTVSLDEVRALGLEEMMDGEGVTAIEWAEKAAGLLPARTVHVRIEGAGDEPRTVTVEGLPEGALVVPR
jgi:tRNA threonylcarbamoyladenosine biosynthesis protein TsaE